MDLKGQKYLEDTSKWLDVVEKYYTVLNQVDDFKFKTFGKNFYVKSW